VDGRGRLREGQPLLRHGVRPGRRHQLLQVRGELHGDDARVLADAQDVRMQRRRVRVEQQAFAKHNLNYVIDKYLPEKLKNPKNFLP
jgi:hypothetical protein